MAPKRTIDLNADVGEAADAAGAEVERALLGLVTTVHIACGGHTGDEATMAATVAAALEHAVRVGAHPSYPDGDGFGRRPMEIDRGELRAVARASSCGPSTVSAGPPAPPIASVKAHGALYAEVAKGGAIYETLRDVVRDGWGDGTDAGAAVGVPRHGDGPARRGAGVRGGVLRPGLPPRREPGRARHGRRGADRSRGGGRAGAEPGPRRGGGPRRQRADAVGGHAVRPLRLPGAVAIATAVRQAMADAGIDVVAPAHA